MTWRELAKQIENLPEQAKDKEVIRFDDNEGEYYSLGALRLVEGSEDLEPEGTPFLTRS
jgi:hypothetical protein